MGEFSTEAGKAQSPQRGIEYKTVRKNGTLVGNVLDEIRRMHADGIALNTGFIREHNAALYGAGLRQYGSWETAIETAGIDYLSVREDTRLSQYYGRAFERLLDELLPEISVICTKQVTVNGCRPDFTMSNGRWLDAKLSEWSIYRCDTVDKYEPHCRSLTIIYARGNDTRDEMITPKTRIISVHQLIKQLPLYRQEYYKDGVSRIQDMADGLVA